MVKLVPDSLRVMRDGKDLTRAAVDNRKRTIPIRGGWGLRLCPKSNGMDATSFQLVRLAPVHYRRALEAAVRKPDEHPTVMKPMLYKSDLENLLISIRAKVRDKLNCYSHTWVSVEYHNGTVGDMILSLVSMFRLVECVTGLERSLWHDGDYNENPDRRWGNFVANIMTLYDRIEVLEDWLKKNKYAYLDELILFITKYGGRCKRRRGQVKREAKRKREEAARMLEAAKQESEAITNEDHEAKDPTGESPEAATAA
jgi:hypothetical protein